MSSGPLPMKDQPSTLPYRLSASLPSFMTFGFVFSKVENLSLLSFSSSKKVRTDLGFYRIMRGLGFITWPYLAAISSQLISAKNSCSFTSSASVGPAPNRLLGFLFKRRRMIERAGGGMV